MSRARNALASWLRTVASACVPLGQFLERRLADRIATANELVAPRRRFLAALLGAGGGLAATAAAALLPSRPGGPVAGEPISRIRPRAQPAVGRDAWVGSRVEGYRRLGRTELHVSDISLGSGSSTGGRQTVELVREAIERGINYLDTAPDYPRSGPRSGQHGESDAEQRIGLALKGQREKLFVATKFCLPEGHLGPGTSVAAYMNAVEGSLARLQTDWVDLVQIHSCNTVERLLDENVHEAFDRLRQQGKVRFLGVSTHTPDLEAVANAALDSDRFDVMTLAYHYGASPDVSRIIDRAAARDIGIVAMQVLRGAQHRLLDWTPDERDAFTQASVAWALSNPSVSCVLSSLWEKGQLDELLYVSGQVSGQVSEQVSEQASGRALPPQEGAVLERYSQLTRASHCRPYCGACLDSCPEALPIHDVLRQRGYFEGFGAEKEAMRLYASMGEPAEVCAGCAAPCTQACPTGVAIPERMRGAHARLSMRPTPIIPRVPHD